MTDPITGGTVRYHRAEYRLDRSLKPWRVWFTEDQPDPCWFTAEQGEAMGLTPPAPAPLVVTCNGHSVELSDEQADILVYLWDAYSSCREQNDETIAKTKLARLLRDARQDPRPTSLSPGEHLRGLLAGRDDADELWTQAKAFKRFDAETPVGQWLQVIGDAAREVHGS